VNDDYGIKCDSSSPDITNSVIKNCGSHGLCCVGSSTVEVTNCKISGNGNGNGVHCHGSEITLSNCLIEDNEIRGVYCYNSGLMVHNCIIEDNESDGIYIYNKNSLSGSITNSRISGNNDHGIYSDTRGSSEIEIKNNWIYGNGADNSGDGINIPDAYPVPAVIRNNTIVNNADHGISSAYAGNATISNCIIWDNHDGELDNCTTTYSCVKNGNTNNGNINDDPCFVNDANNNYHLSPYPDSPCIDAGDSNLPDPNETDINGEPRIFDGDDNGTDIVDMGADEYYWSPADFDLDEIVNFFDYAILASAWQTDDPNISLDDDNDIDIDDLARFCDDWLWQRGRQMSMGSGLGRALYTAVPLEQAQLALEPVSQLQFQPLTEADIEELLDWLQELWLTDEELREAMDEDQWREFIESVR
jgi:parallel beta-helix repeat protein